MRKIISTIIFTLIFAAFAAVSFAKDDIFAKFYGNRSSCELLAKAGYDAYAHFGQNHKQLLSFGSDDAKYDQFFEDKFQLLKKSQYVAVNSSLFTDNVIEQLIKDGIYIWERSGDSYLQNKDADYKNRMEVCMGKQKLVRRGE